MSSFSENVNAERWRTPLFIVKVETDLLKQDDQDL